MILSPQLRSERHYCIYQQVVVALWGSELDRTCKLVLLNPARFFSEVYCSCKQHYRLSAINIPHCNVQRLPLHLANTLSLSVGVPLPPPLKSATTHSYSLRASSPTFTLSIYLILANAPPSNNEENLILQVHRESGGDSGGSNGASGRGALPCAAAHQDGAFAAAPAV
jgi:hypothetical protein